ncbi:MAG: transglutaminase domain-containing protein [Eubacterium sp.]|nr:transglutaminase domain-containing protein [Eubacterium sp.]
MKSKAILRKAAAFLAAVLLVTAVCGAVPSVKAEAANSGSTVPVYRMFNSHTGEHFYTVNRGERNSLMNAGWNYESVGWYAPQHSDSPVYRLFNPITADHHYTMNPGEKDFLAAHGWNYEGVAFYSDDNHAVPIYRNFSPKARIGAHNYTTSADEYNLLARSGWNAEGVGFYAVSGQSYEPLSQADARAAYPQACATLDQVGWDLRAAYNWSTGTIKYLRGVPVTLGVRQLANMGFTTHRGNCLVYAATFYEMATALGYEARQMWGGVAIRRGAPSPHSWTEVKVDGQWYVIDPSFGRDGKNGFMIHYGDKGTYVYVNYYPIN